jgi:hypothetical protein
MHVEERRVSRTRGSAAGVDDEGGAVRDTACGTREGPEQTARGAARVKQEGTSGTRPRMHARTHVKARPRTPTHPSSHERKDGGKAVTIWSDGVAKA